MNNTQVLPSEEKRIPFHKHLQSNQAFSCITKTTSVVGKFSTSNLFCLSASVILNFSDKRSPEP